MQTIHHKTPNIHQIFNDIDRLYTFTSQKFVDRQLLQQSYNEAFRSVFRLFKEYGGVNYPIQYQNAKYKPVDVPEDSESIILCFSGGKDSTATAIKLQEQYSNVYLYHLKGINFTYKDEYKTAEKVAERLGLPIIVEEVQLKGKQEWVEHPLKNWIIANGALQYGISNHIGTRVAFGNFSSSTLDSDPFAVCGGDCAELWHSYNDIIQTIIPQFEMYTPLFSMGDTLDILMKHKDIAVLCQSCIGAYRYREYLKRNNEKKYGIQLPEHRCGSCWKCCLEYIVYCDNDIYEYNEGFYRHCMDILRKTLKAETGIRYSMDDVWSHYFFYSKERSKYYG